MQLKIVKIIDPQMIFKMAKLEAESFGSGGLNEWTLPVFIRYGRVFMLQDEDDILGLAQFIKDWNDEKTVFLVGLSIQPSVRGRGFSRLFLSGILGHLKGERIELVKLTVSNENIKALQLYQGLGFKQERQLMDEYGKGIDRTLMTLNLEEI